MSVYEGKKLIGAIQAFNEKAAHENDNTVFKRIAYALQRRPLGEGHFSQAHDFLNELRDAAHIKIADILHYNPESTLKNRELSSFLMYMGVTKTADGGFSPDEYIPSVMRTITRQDLFSLTNRPLPLVFSSQHTEFRFIQRTGNKLEYGTLDSQWAIITGLIMAATIGKEMQKSGVSHAPVAIPYAGGFYLGHAALCHKEDHYPAEYIVAARTDKNGKPFLHGLKEGERIVTVPDWSPNTYIRILTYISGRELKPAQAALYNKFDALFKKPWAEPAFNAVMNSYANLMPLPANESMYVDWAAAEFTKIYQSAEWKSVNKHGQSHLPRNDIN